MPKTPSPEEERPEQHNDAWEEWEEEEEEEEYGPSKTQRKKVMLELRDLGKRLTELNGEQLDRLSVNGGLRGAVEEYQRLKSREGKRRQLQFIGKLMRNEETEAIREGLELFDAGSRQSAAVHHGLERQRQALVDGGADALTRFVNEYPNTDVQRLRQMVRNAKKDAKEEKNRGHSKKLYRLLKGIYDEYNSGSNDPKNLS